MITGQIPSPGRWPANEPEKHEKFWAQHTNNSSARPLGNLVMVETNFQEPTLADNLTMYSPPRINSHKFLVRRPGHSFSRNGGVTGERHSDIS